MACTLTAALDGHAQWWGERDSDGYRTYHIVHKVLTDNTAGFADGPYNVLTATGLPLPGSFWNFDGDVDVYAICQWDATVSPLVEGERTEYWKVEQVFTTKPTDKCINRTGTGTGTGNPANDPLLEPPRLSGNFVKYTEEKTLDRFGNIICNSAFERIRGPLVEFDASRLTIRVTINEGSLNIDNKTAIIDTVNISTLWGFAARTVKLSNISWEQKYSGNCDCYYEVMYEFEVSPTGFDREVADEGTKALHGQWNKTTKAWELININGGAPDPNNPTHFKRIIDFNGNPMRATLNGAGIPATTYDLSGTSSTEAGLINIEYYEESDFLGEISGLPSDLECVA